MMGAPPVRAGALQLRTISDPVHSTRAMAEGAEGTSGGRTEAGGTRTAVMRDGYEGGEDDGEGHSCQIEQRRKAVEIHNDE